MKCNFASDSTQRITKYHFALYSVSFVSVCIIIMHLYSRTLHELCFWVSHHKYFYVFCHLRFDYLTILTWNHPSKFVTHFIDLFIVCWGRVETLRHIYGNHRTTWRPHLHQPCGLRSSNSGLVASTLTCHSVSPLNCLIFNHIGIQTGQINVVTALWSCYLRVWLKTKTTAWALCMLFTWYTTLNEKGYIDHHAGTPFNFNFRLKRWKRRKEP